MRGPKVQPVQVPEASEEEKAAAERQRLEAERVQREEAARAARESAGFARRLRGRSAFLSEAGEAGFRLGGV